MTRESAAALGLQPGREVVLAIKASSIAVLE
jgi:molybdopterin-binding protein